MSPSFMSSLEASCSFLQNQLLKYHLQFFASCAETCFSYSAGVFCCPFFPAVPLFSAAPSFLLPSHSCCLLFPAALSFLLPLSFLLALRDNWVYKFAFSSAALQLSFHHNHFGPPKPTYVVITSHTKCLITEPSSALGFTNGLSTGINSHFQVIPPLFTFSFFPSTGVSHQLNHPDYVAPNLSRNAAGRKTRILEKI
jgi:hypothetical protein